MFDNQMSEKKRIEDGAMSLQRKMNQVGGKVELCFISTRLPLHMHP